jgi:thiol:disulfide interchange protein/DsbC/DsbD-like thiol-disulfide interchange protein
MKLLAWLLMFVSLLCSTAAHAQTPPNMAIYVKAELAAETINPAPGSTVTLAITMQPEAGWHGYWSNPGDAGEGLTLDWKLPAGVTTSPLRFPVPETLIISGFMNYVYERPHAVLVDVKLPENAPVGTKLPIGADAYWLACTDKVCVPQQGRLSVELTIGDGRVEAASQKRFDVWRGAVPAALDREARFAVAGKTLEIAIPYPATARVEAPYFFPAASGVINHMAVQTTRRNGDWLIVQTLLADSSSDPVDAIEGLLRIGPDQGLLVRARPGEVPAGGVAVSGSADGRGKAPAPALLWLLLAAVVGGVLLNIMPCVFPILGLKAVALAKAGGDEQTARTDAAAYTAGVILSCIVLGGIMLGLRAGGEEVGWAFQLQEPGFVLFLLILMVGVTANLMGLFELSGFAVGDSLARKSGLAGSFWTGALAAIVATPCTGPFMAAALGAALLLPALPALALFAALGFGVALPFLLIAYIPALRNRLPKPGPWLITFRKVMAVPMGLTALALLWLLWRLSGTGALAVGAVTATVFIIIAVVARRWQAAHKGALIAGSGVFLGAISILALPHFASADQVWQVKSLPSERFSESRLNALRQEGLPVFVYFTADWCLTCKVNEATVLERPETAKLFAANSITVLRGDFTRRDSEIARFLAAQGAAGIPLYLYYPKGSNARQLPQLLSQSALEDMLATAR